MIYCLLEPLYWTSFDPPVANDGRLDKPASMTLLPGLVHGPGLEVLLGRDLFDKIVEAKMLEPIP